MMSTTTHATDIWILLIEEREKKIDLKGQRLSNRSKKK